MTPAPGRPLQAFRIDRNTDHVGSNRAQQSGNGNIARILDPDRIARLQQKIANLFEHRYLFVQHDLTEVQRRTLRTITRGVPPLRALREVMEEVYRLFDRRCHTDTALTKLARLRRRVRSFKPVGQVLSTLRSPNLDKALTFLDDKLLPSTSNAVERGNRRHRKMQKTVYRVRTQEHVHNRIALDMLRASQAEARRQTLETLHHTRKGQKSRW